MAHAFSAEIFDFVMFFSAIKSWFWSERFWLPANTTWNDFRSDPDTYIPQLKELWLCLPLTACLLFLRLLWERYIALPIGRRYHLTERIISPTTSISILEKAYYKHREVLPSQAEILSYSEELNWKPHEVERWWRRRCKSSKPCKMSRFQETSWRFVFYLAIFYYGLVILWHQPWFWHSQLCFSNYPRQHVPVEIRWYYLMEISSYMSLLASACFDIKRKDFWQHLIHHFVTLVLLVCSWATNMIRIGCVVVCLHDSCDYWLEGGKMLLYLRYTMGSNLAFIVFASHWIIARLVIYPMSVWVVYKGPDGMELYPMFHCFQILLLVVQLLDVFWFIMIFWHAVKLGCSLFAGEKSIPDSRSDDDSDSSCEDEPIHHQQVNAGHTSTRCHPTTLMPCNDTCKKDI